MLKPLSLLITRLGTGFLLVIWGLIRLADPATGPGLAEKYYGGLAASSVLQTGWGAAQLIIGALVVLGLLRKFVYPLQAVVLVGGALAIWQYLLDPLGLFLLDEESRNVLFFPSLTVAGAVLVLLAFREEDTYSLDAIIKR